MTKAQKSLIADAVAAGLNVSESASCVTIRTGKTHRSAGLHLWPDGTATRSDVELSLCSAIRSAAAMRRVVGL